MSDPVPGEKAPSENFAVAKLLAEILGDAVTNGNGRLKWERVPRIINDLSEAGVTVGAFKHGNFNREVKRYITITVNLEVD